MPCMKFEKCLADTDIVVQTYFWLLQHSLARSSECSALSRTSEEQIQFHCSCYFLFGVIVFCGIIYRW